MRGFVNSFDVWGIIWNHFQNTQADLIGQNGHLRAIVTMVQKVPIGVPLCLSPGFVVWGIICDHISVYLSGQNGNLRPK